MKINNIIDRFIEFSVIISLSGMIGSVVVQVFTRFFMDSAPHWTEEAARVFFIFSVAFASGLAIRDHAYVRLDYFINKFSVSNRNKILLAIHWIILMFGLLISFYSITFITIGSTETSPSIQINMSFVFSSLLFLGLLISYYSARILFIYFSDNKLRNL